MTLTVKGILEDGTDNYSTGETVTVSSASEYEVVEGLGSGGADWVGYYVATENVYRYVRSVSVSGSSAYYAIITSAEGVNTGFELPVFSFLFDTTGAYKISSFKDLRQGNVSQSLSSDTSEYGIVHTDGTIIVDGIHAGEDLAKGAIIYIHPDDGLAYNAIAANQSVHPDLLYQVQALGVVYPKPIAAGGVGSVLCRGVFGLSTQDPLYQVYGTLTPGVIVVSKDDAGEPQDVKVLVDFTKKGDKAFVPWIRVIESFGAVVAEVV